MEAVGLGLGVAGALASAREATVLRSSYKNAEAESQPHNLKSEAAPILLRKWCESVGYGDGRLAEPHHANLDDSKVRRLVDRIVRCIRELNDNCKENQPSNLTASVKTSQRSMSRKERLAWAWQEKNKISSQTQNVEDLLQCLRDLVPPFDPQTPSPSEIALDVIVNKATTSLTSYMNNAEKERRIDEFKGKIADWLGTASTTDLFDTVLEKRLEGTCEWIFEREEYQKWATPASPKTKALWIHGPAGYGKTILSTRIIERLQSTNSNVVYHYFTADAESHADPFIIIRVWIHGLIAQSEEAFNLARTKWEASDRRPASLTAIKELFTGITQTVPEVVLLVDGLDECAGTGYDWRANYQASLLDFFTFLADSFSNNQPARLAMISRNEPEIRTGFRVSEHEQSWILFECPIASSDVKDDATRFAKNIVSRKLKKKSEKEQDELSARIVSRFDSMFLGIRMLQEQLKGWKSQESLARTIDQAPTQLNDLYDKNWQRIAKLSEPDRNRAFAMLRWAAFAKRPMSVMEITEALVIPEEDLDITLEDLPENIDDEYIDSEILEPCGPLLEVRGRDPEVGWRTVHLAHFSVKQYILCHEFVTAGQLISNEKLRLRHEATSNNVLALACLRLFRLRRAWVLSSDQPRLLKAFRRYAFDSWHQHIMPGGPNADQVVAATNSFFSQEDHSWELWRQEAELRIGDWKLVYHLPLENSSKLFYAAYYNLIDTLEYLMDTGGVDVNDCDISGRTALHAAAFMGDLATVKKLVDRNADVNVADGSDFTPLFFAVIEGHLGVCELLLEAGADMSVELFGQTVFSAAAMEGHLEIVRLFLDRGADPNLAWREGKTPLFSACFKDNMKIAKLLIEHGANPITLDHLGRSPLAQAIGNGNVDMVRLLLESGADYTVFDRLLEGPLIQAYRRGHAEIVRLFLDRGADPNLAWQEGKTPLFSACFKDNMKIAKLLIEHGANPITLDHLGRSPLA